MAAIGGSLQALGIAGRLFPVSADAEVQRKLGGFENEVLANGDGSARMIKTRVPLSLPDIVVEIDDDRADQEFLQQIANLNDFSVILLEYPGGQVWQGRAQIVGEFQASSQSATASVSLMGPGILTQQ